MMVTMTIASPLLLLLIPILIVFYYRLAQMYRHSSREIKRMESITNSFVASQFSETVDGLATIRSFGCQVCVCVCVCDGAVCALARYVRVCE